MSDQMAQDHTERPEDLHCPVCGYYCIGKGGVGCIDKPKLVEPAARNVNVASYVREWERRAEQAETEAVRLREQMRDLTEVLEDKRRLTRELDVAISGPDGAAKQASLCDLIAPAKALREQVQGLLDDYHELGLDYDVRVREVAGLRAQERALLCELAGADARVNALQGELAEAREQLAKWRRSFKGHVYVKNEKYAALVAERDAARAENETLKGMVKALTGKD